MVTDGDAETDGVGVILVRSLDEIVPDSDGAGVNNKVVTE